MNPSKIKKKNTFLFIISFLTLCHTAFAQLKNSVILPPDASEAEIVKSASQIVPSPRQLRWQKLELTGFFHFGVNTFTGEEWGNGKEDPKIFNPKHLNAEQWVREAKAMGIKQVIFTAKHHDGFCLWPTKTTVHSIESSPYKNGKGDLVKEVALACKKYKMGFGIYLSPWDRNSKFYGTDEYNDFFEKQLTELLTNYGKIDEVWFDGANGEGADGKKQVYDFESWYRIIRNNQPQATIAIMGPDVRWVGTESGQGRETEWSVVPADNLSADAIAENSQKGVAFQPQGDMKGSDLGSRKKILKAKGLVWYPAETDVSIRPGWFYKKSQDNNVKSPQKLFDIYFNSVGRNGVLLLNIPPDKEGLISKYDVASMQGFKDLFQKTFSKNLAKGAKIKASSGKNTAALLDNLYTTYWTSNQADSTVNIEFTLPKAQTFDVLMLQENIALGQQIEDFELQIWQKGKWKKVAEGTTVGYKRLLKFSAVTAKKVKLVILSARANPKLSAFGLYKNAAK